MRDKLTEIFEKQKKLQDDLIIDRLYLNQNYINLNLLACYSELAEIQSETAWKNPTKIKYGWKFGQQTNLINFKNEIIDLQHFVINLALAAGMDAKEFHELYINKNKINHKRKEDGY